MMNNKNYHTSNIITMLLLAWLFAGCQSDPQKLPILGERDTVTKTINGQQVVDTVYHTIPDFSFVNQYGDTVTQANTANKIYVTDFFFTSCPTICPIMKKEMLRVYKSIDKEADVIILSHSIDPTHDTPTVLKQYADDLGVSGTKWQFLTGNREKIYDIGQNHYLVTAGTDSTAPGGYIHSGAFMLIDKKRRVRGMYDGTLEKAVDKLIKDIEILKKEND
jgi:protein SCO1